MIEVVGENGESLMYDGSFVIKMRHYGKQEAARNPASTYRQCDVRVREKQGVRRYEALLACQAFFSLTFPEESKAAFDALIATLEAQKG